MDPDPDPGSSYCPKEYISSENGQHPPSSKIETPLSACSVDNYTDRQVVQYTGTADRAKKGVSIQDDGVCCPFSEDIQYSGFFG